VPLAEERATAERPSLVDHAPARLRQERAGSEFVQKGQAPPRQTSTCGYRARDFDHFEGGDVRLPSDLPEVTAQRVGGAVRVGACAGPVRHERIGLSVKLLELFSGPPRDLRCLLGHAARAIFDPYTHDKSFASSSPSLCRDRD
jgi:hypothetical protein